MITLPRDSMLTCFLCCDTVIISMFVYLTVTSLHSAKTAKSIWLAEELLFSDTKDLVEIW